MILGDDRLRDFTVCACKVHDIDPYWHSPGEFMRYDRATRQLRLEDCEWHGSISDRYHGVSTTLHLGAAWVPPLLEEPSSDFSLLAAIPPDSDWWTMTFAPLSPDSHDS